MTGFTPGTPGVTLVANTPVVYEKRGVGDVVGMWWGCGGDV